MIANFKNCIESVDKKYFFIQDGENSQKPAFIVEKNGEFEVTNNTDTPIYLLKTDSCIYDSSDKTRCDCVIYNDNIFCFIELKSIKLKNFTKKRKEAENQLIATIQDFKNEDIIQNKILEAYACLNCKNKLDDSFEPITQRPKNTSIEDYFRNTLNTRLYYKTKKEFN